MTNEEMLTAEELSLQGKFDSSQRKLPYRTPTLKVHGSVRELTGSGSGGNADGTMFMA